MIDQTYLQEIAAIPIALLFTAITIATIANGTERGSVYFNRNLGIWIKLIPKWNFFAPNPGRHDYHLLYRDRYEDGSLSDWQEISDLVYSRSWLDSVWNPYYYRTKVIHDTANRLLVNISNHEPTHKKNHQSDHSKDLIEVDIEPFERSVLYLIILNYVTVQERAATTEATQFMVMQSSRRAENAEPLFVSSFHEVDA